MIFVSFWARFNQAEDDFMGNMELPFDDFSGIADVVVAEELVKAKLNEGEVDDAVKVNIVTITNWRRFNT